VRLAVLSALLLWGGATLLLSEVPWFRRRSLGDRLLPYASDGSAAAGRGPGVLSIGSFRDVVGPLASSWGGRLARLAGVDESLTMRLARVHDEADPTAFRVQQLGWAALGLAAGSAIALVVQTPPLLGLAAALGGAALGFLLIEQRLAARSAAWQRRVFLELPIVAEQLGMLVSAGYSLGAAVNRLAHRGTGAIGHDLRRVVGRIRQGLSEVEALREWADLVDVDGVDRLVAVLALNQEAGDLGRLVSDEARALRRDAQRELVEAIERRSQQVWIPVTVATLVPGVIFLAVPFIEALRVFSGA
jgi:Flp pilus assembly protein TadB